MNKKQTNQLISLGVSSLMDSLELKKIELLNLENEKSKVVVKHYHLRCKLDRIVDGVERPLKSLEGLVSLTEAIYWGSVKSIGRNNVTVRAYEELAEHMKQINLKVETLRENLNECTKD